MKKKARNIYCKYNILFLVLLINILLFFFNPFIGLTPAEKSIDTRVIIWNFDDINIQSLSETRRDLWLSMIENITKHGGMVGVGFTPTWSDIPPQNLTYTSDEIDYFNSLIVHDNAFAFYHCWNHTVRNEKTPWERSLEEQRIAMNHTMWTFYNNFGYNLNSFLGAGGRGDYNTTVVLVERDLVLIWGNSNHIPYAEGLKYHSIAGKPSRVQLEQWNTGDPWPLEGVPKGLDALKENFTRIYESEPIVHISGHPGRWGGHYEQGGIGPEEALLNFSLFTEWIYTNHDLMSMDFYDAYDYKEQLDENTVNDTPGLTSIAILLSVFIYYIIFNKRKIKYE